MPHVVTTHTKKVLLKIYTKTVFAGDPKGSHFFLIVQELRDKKGGDCADSPTSMKFGTNVVYGVEIQIFEGAEAGVPLGGRGGKSKMAAVWYLNFSITS